MYVTSKAGTEILKSEYQIIDSINGVPTIETEYGKLEKKHTEPMVMLSPAFNDKFIMVIKEQESVSESSRLRLTGVHSFIYDFSLDRIYEEYTQYFSLNNILTLIFSDTEYEYEVSGSARYNALEFKNFGDNDKMSLINQICDRWELEYKIQGNKVYFDDQRGSKTMKQFRYKMNIYDSHVNLDITEGATYIRAYFGKKDEENPSNSTYVEKEMLHPLAEDFGVRHAKPYSNEVITQEETMQRYMKMKIEETWKLSVEIDVLDLSGDGSVEVGDEVWAIDERLDLKYKTRIVEKRDYYDVNDRIYRTKVVLGNKTFIEAVSAQEVTADDVESQVVKYYNQMIEQLKADFDNDFNAERDAYKAMLEKAKEDIFTEIAADKDRMENEWQEQWDTGMSEIQNGIKEAERKATENATRIENDIKSDLDKLTQNHGSILDELLEDVMDIDDFLGTSRSITLDQRFLDISQNFEDRLRKVDSNTFNMIRGTRFDEPDMFHLYSGAELQEEGDVKFVTLYSERFNEPRVHFTESVTLEKGKKYIVAVDYRSYGAKELDRLAIGDMNGYYNLIDDIDKPLSDLHTDGQWRRTYGTVIPSETVSGEFQIGTNFDSGDDTRERIDIKLVYLTGSNNTDWVYHPQDATQSIEEITRRITHLEDGYSEFVTKSLYDAETDTLNQYIKSVEQTVEGNELILQRVENWQATNGQSVLETVDAYERKLWLNDFADIGANLIPQSSASWENGSYWSTGVENNSLPENIRLKKDTGVLVAGDVMYTFSDQSSEASNIRSWMILQLGSDGRTVGEPIYCPVGREVTFRTTTNRLVFTAYPVEGKEVRLSGLNNRIKTIYAKLERGSSATPMLNAISHIEQLADEISMQVQSLDGTFLKQTDFKLTPDYWQLGAIRIGAEEVSGVLRGSPDAIDAVVSEFNLTGNLNAKGQITSLAVDAIEGNFARLFTARLNANIITTDHISGLSAEFQRMYILNANIERLVAQNVFTQNVKALSIEAVEGQFSSLMTKYFSANYIDVNYINGKNAWFETQYVKTSNISNLTSQIAFIRDIQTIEITANQMNINTLHNKLKSVEGGLTIYGPDGRVLINNSILRASFDVQIRPMHNGSGVTFTGFNYQTSSSIWQTFEYFYTDFKGSQLLVSWAVSFSGPSASENIEVRVRGFGGYNPIGTSPRTLFNNGGTTYFNQTIDLGVPNYNTIQAYLEFRRDPSGSSNQNIVTARVLRVSLIN